MLQKPSAFVQVKIYVFIRQRNERRDFLPAIVHQDFGHFSSVLSRSRS